MRPLPKERSPRALGASLRALIFRMSWRILRGLADGTDDCMDAGGTTPGMGEVERRREPPPRATAAFDVPVSRGTCASCTSPGTVAEEAGSDQGWRGELNFFVSLPSTLGRPVKYLNGQD